MWTGEKRGTCFWNGYGKKSKKNWRIGIVTKLLEILSILLTNFLTAAPLEFSKISNSSKQLFNWHIFSHNFPKFILKPRLDSSPLAISSVKNPKSKKNFKEVLSQEYEFSVAKWL